MNIFNLFSLVGGVAFFLYGMAVMSSNLEKMAGGKLEKTLRKMTSNPFKGLMLGAGATAVVQSSSAVTVMMVGLVNSGVMTLNQVVSVILGSNIGTTITAWILSLTGIESSSIGMQMLKPEHFTPLLALVGIIMMMSSKKQKKKDTGAILMGFSVLMFGMLTMSAAVAPLADMPQFTNILTAFDNPLLGVLAGTAFTAAIQSSAASVGILQALSLTGKLTYGTVIPIIMGQNIGTCISAVLAAIGTNKNAKRVAAVHISFNVIATVVFLSGWLIADGIWDFAITSQVVEPYNIAILHSIFNLSAVLLMLPFTKQLEKLAKFFVRDGSKQNALLDENLLGIPSFAIGNAMGVTIDMAKIASDAVFSGTGIMRHYSEEQEEKIRSLEQQLDDYEGALEIYLAKISKEGLTDKEMKKNFKMHHAIPDFERMGDHALNLVEVSREIDEKEIEFSKYTSKELGILYQAVEEIMAITTESYVHNDEQLARTVEPLEEVIDNMIAEIKNRQIKRLQDGIATIQIGYVLSDLLTNLERISDHCTNVAVAIIETDLGLFDQHDYVEKTKRSNNPQFYIDYNEFRVKYYDRMVEISDRKRKVTE